MSDPGPQAPAPHTTNGESEMNSQRIGEVRRILLDALRALEQGQEFAPVQPGSKVMGAAFDPTGNRIVEIDYGGEDFTEEGCKVSLLSVRYHN